MSIHTQTQGSMKMKIICHDDLNFCYCSSILSVDSDSALNSSSDSLMSGRQHPGSATPQNELEWDTSLSVTSDFADVSLSILKTSLPPSSSLSLDDIADDTQCIPIKPPSGPVIPDTLDINARFDKLVACCTENAATMADGVNKLQAEMAKTRRQFQKRQASMTKEASTMKETLEMTTSRLDALELRQDTQEQRLQAQDAMLENVLLGLEKKAVRQ